MILISLPANLINSQTDFETLQVKALGKSDLISDQIFQMKFMLSVRSEFSSLQKKSDWVLAGGTMILSLRGGDMGWCGARGKNERAESIKTSPNIVMGPQRTPHKFCPLSPFYDTLSG